MASGIVDFGVLEKWDCIECCLCNLVVFNFVKWREVDCFLFFHSFFYLWFCSCGFCSLR